MAKGLIAPFYRKQTQTKSELLNNGTFACVNVDVSMMLNDYKNLCKFCKTFTCKCVKMLNIFLLC